MLANRPACAPRTQRRPTLLSAQPGPAACAHAPNPLTALSACLPAARLAENAPEPFDKEVTLCDQLAAYLQKFVAAVEAAEEEEKKDLSGALEGFKPLAVGAPAGGRAGGALAGGRADSNARHAERARGRRASRLAGRHLGLMLLLLGSGLGGVGGAGCAVPVGGVPGMDGIELQPAASCSMHALPGAPPLCQALLAVVERLRLCVPCVWSAAAAIPQLCASDFAAAEEDI